MVEVRLDCYDPKNGRGIAYPLEASRPANHKSNDFHFHRSYTSEVAEGHRHGSRQR